MGQEAFLAAQILDFAEATDDRVAALLLAGTGITLTYNDAANTLTIASTVSPTWGSIGGTLSSQTDLQNALNAKLGGSTGSNDNRILRSDGTGGATVQASAVTIDDTGNISGLGTVACGAITASGSVQVTNTPGNVFGIIRSGNNVIFDGGRKGSGSGSFLAAENSSGYAFDGGWGGVRASAGIGLSNQLSSPYSWTIQCGSGYGVEIGNGANPGRLNLYGTYTNASNYRRLYISSTTAGAFTLGVEGLGTGSSGNTLSIGNSLTVNGVVFVGTYTVATLPSAAANAGALAQVTDSSVTANGSAVAGSGSNRVVVFSNGSTWDVVVA